MGAELGGDMGTSMGADLGADMRANTIIKDHHKWMTYVLLRESTYTFSFL